MLCKQNVNVCVFVCERECGRKLLSVLEKAKLTVSELGSMVCLFSVGSQLLNET